MASRAVLRSPADAWRFWNSPSQPAPLARRLRAWSWLSPFAGRRWDVVYFPDPEAAFAFPGLFELGRAVIVSAFDGQRRAGDLVPRLAVARGLPWIFTKATRVHCASHFVLRHLVEGGVDPGKVVVVPPEVDLEFFCPRVGPSSHAEFRIVATVGSGLSTQGLEHTLLALQRLKRSSVPARLEMLGDCVGEERHRALYTIQDLDLFEDVHLHGTLATDATRQILRSSDVFVNADLGADVSVTALQAMACGLPIVTVDSGGTCETIADRGEGRIVPAWSPEGLARALAELWTDAATRRRLGAAARRRIADTVPMAVDRLLVLCRDAARAAA
jgi:glycosyltransferase involved in cell wall biosynthesis